MVFVTGGVEVTYGPGLTDVFWADRLQ